MDKDFVTYKRFTWVVTLMITAFMSVNAVMWSEVKEVKGELNGYKDVTFEKIAALQLQTTKIETNVKWIRDLFANYTIEIE